MSIRLYQEIAYRLVELKDASLIIKEVTLEADWDRYFTISLSLSLMLYLSPPSRKWHCESNSLLAASKVSVWDQTQAVWFTSRSCEQALESLQTTTHKTTFTVNLVPADRCDVLHWAEACSGQTNKIQVLATALINWPLTTWLNFYHFM